MEKRDTNVQHEQTSTTFFKKELAIKQSNLEAENQVKLNETYQQSIKCTKDDKENQLGIQVIKKKSKSKKLPPLNSACQSPNSRQALQKSQKKCKPIKSTKLIGIESVRNIVNPKQMIIKPIQQGKIFKANIFRNPTCTQNQMTIMMKGSNTQLMKAKKMSSLFSSRVHLILPSNNLQQNSDTEQLSEKNSQPLIGCIKGNMIGSIFNVYQGHQEQNQLIATIAYESPERMCGNRVVQIYYRDRRFNTYLDSHQKKLDNLKKVYEKDPQNQSILKVKNLTPRYDKQSGQFMLPINGQQSCQSSIHNIVFVNKDKQTAFRFYKNKQKSYCLEIYNPMTPLVAYSFVMSSFIFKLVSQ